MQCDIYKWVSLFSLYHVRFIFVKMFLLMRMLIISMSIDTILLFMCGSCEQGRATHAAAADEWAFVRYHSAQFRGIRCLPCSIRGGVGGARGFASHS